MSQSPVDDFSEEITSRYRFGWAALSRLLHMGRSFSGREKNCAFLNTGGGRFTDISSVSGFDFPDDARTVIATDWDFDGDLDLWTSARTAPRLRLLRNDLAQESTFVSLRLHGDGTKVNRDAIGARVVVSLKEDPRPITRTVRGGDSFLSQNGAWLHFGIGRQAGIESVMVHWPGGNTEAFKEISPTGFYDLHFGTGKAQAWSPPKVQSALLPATQEPEPESERTRIVLTQRLPLPMLWKEDGTEIPTTQLKGPLLINLWASWCPACLDELKDWVAHAGDYRSKGLRVLVLNTEGLDESGDPTRARETLKEMAFPFDSAPVNADTVQILDLFQRSYLDSWQPLPVPASFLIDTNGSVAVIYKGSVHAKDVLYDLPLLKEKPAALRVATSPFRGRWAMPPASLSTSRFTSQLLDHTKLEWLETYLRRFIRMELENQSPNQNAIKTARQTLAILEAERPKPSASEMLEKARQAVAENQKDGAARMHLADILRGSGDFSGAIKEYKEALRYAPGLTVAAGKLCWTLAAHPDAEIRSPDEALAIANKLIQLTGGKDPNYLDLLGIAQAASGDFKGAASSVRSAMALVPGNSPVQNAFRSRLSLYEAGKPFFDESWRKK